MFQEGRLSNGLNFSHGLNNGRLSLTGFLGRRLAEEEAVELSPTDLCTSSTPLLARASFFPLAISRFF